MKSFKIFAAALMLVFAISLTSSQACDKTQAKNTSGKACTSAKTASNSECTMQKDASGKTVKAECSATMKNASGKCPAGCTGKATKLEAKNSLKTNNTSTKEKTAAATPISK